MDIYAKITGATLLVAGAAAALPAQAFELKGAPKPAFIYYGEPNDGGWIQSFEEARPAMETELGTKFLTVDNIPEDNAKVTAVAERLIKRGVNIIVGTAYGYSDAFNELAKKYPHVAFLNANGTHTGPNLASFYGRTYESQYLCGMTAAAMSKTGKLGFVEANPIGSVVWSIDAYALGAEAVNPKATVSVVYTGIWNDPVKERQAAAALIDQGADVIGQGVDTPTSQIVAQEHNVYSTGNWRDMSEFAPKANLCSQTWTWAKLLNPQFRAIKDGSWSPGNKPIFTGIAKGGTDISLTDLVPADVKARVMKARQEIIDGKDIFAGPLKDTKGKVEVAAGQHMTDAQLWSMNWYVPGVQVAQ